RPGPRPHLPPPRLHQARRLRPNRPHHRLRQRRPHRPVQPRMPLRPPPPPEDPRLVAGPARHQRHHRLHLSPRPPLPHPPRTHRRTHRHPSRPPAPQRLGPPAGRCGRHRAGGKRQNRCVDELISDPDDERVADYRALTDVALRTKFEPPHGLFIAEGELVLRRALRAGYRLRSMLIDVKRRDQLSTVDTGGAPVYLADQAVLEKITGFHVHRGVLASFHRRPLPAAADVLAEARRVAILENLNNNTNLG